MERRARSAETTRSDILRIAQRQFATVGYDRTTLRSIAATVGVDPAMVVRYFGSKAGLFAEAVRSELTYPDLAELGPGDAVRLVNAFLDTLEGNRILLALMRSAATSEEAAAQMREVLLDQGGPALGRLARDNPRERAALVGSTLLGFAFTRHILRIPALVAMDREATTRWLAPVIEAILTGEVARR